jgi:hypothetical protein
MHSAAVRAALLALCAAAAAASPAAASPAAAGDGDDALCSLNGAYNATSRTCACYGPWSGPTCGTLSVLPVPKPSGYGMSPNVSSWGGNVVQHGGQYHLIAAEMTGGCTLANWSTHSQCVHATAAAPEGPYTRQGVAVGVFCHNPETVAFTNATDGQPMFALFHIGDGTSRPPPNCSAAVEGAGAGTLAPPATGSTVHVASDPAGPWTPLAQQPPTCNNPAPLLHPNGTWFLVCSNGAFVMFRAPALEGPWTHVTDIPTRGGPAPGAWEDPFLYLDPRGNFHLLAHVWSNVPQPTCANTNVSGHLFSADGLTWGMGAEQPYTGHVAFTDGSSLTMTTRERPKLMFDPVSGEPTHLLNGAVGGPSSCPPWWCSHCKMFFWTFTLVQPLGTGEGGALAVGAG